MTKALAHARTIGDELIGMSLWDDRLATLATVDRCLLQAELDELESSGDLRELIDNALKRARARVSDRSEAEIVKDVTITAQKRKRKLWMNAILPISIAALRLVAYRDGKYAWEVVREEIQRIIVARMPKYLERDRIRADAHELLASLRMAVADDDRTALVAATADLAGIRSRIAVYWAQENYDAHSDYLYGFSDSLQGAPELPEGTADETAQEFEAHRLRPKQRQRREKRQERETDQVATL